MFGLDPKIELKKDPLNGAVVRMVKGHFENIANDCKSYVPDGLDTVRSPRLEFGKFLIVESGGKATDTAIVQNVLPAVRFTTPWTGPQIVAGRTAAVAKANANTTNAQLVTFLSGKAGAFGLRVLWQNKKMKYSKGSEKSLAADCLLLDISSGSNYNSTFSIFFMMSLNLSGKC